MRADLPLNVYSHAGNPLQALPFTRTSFMFQEIPRHSGLLSWHIYHLLAYHLQSVQVASQQLGRWSAVVQEDDGEESED